LTTHETVATHETETSWKADNLISEFSFRLSDTLTDKRSDEPTERTRAAVASNAEEYRSRIAKRLRAVKARAAVVERYPVKSDLLDASANKSSDKPKTDTRAAVASNAEEYRSRIAKRLRAVKGRMCGGKATEEQIADRLEADVSTKRSDEPTERTRAAVASNAEEYRSRIAKRLRAVKAVSSREWHPVDKPILEDTLTSKIDPIERTRVAVAN